MTPDKVIEWAREAGGTVEDAWFCDVYSFNLSNLIRFAQLARADMREQCAKEVEKYDDQSWFLLQQDDCAAALRALKD